MSSTETLKDLETKEKQAQDLLKWIKDIVDALINDELTLADIVAEEESLKNRCYELQETCKKIINLRQYLDFEIYGEQLERNLKK